MAAKYLTPGQKERVARYLAHTTRVAEGHYRMTMPDQVTETTEMLLFLEE